MKNPSWKDMAETVGLVAIVASLILVGWELRETRKGMQSQFFQARAFQSIESTLHVVDRPEILAAVRKYRREGRKALTAQELDTVHAYATIELTDKGNDHYQYVNGFLDEDFYSNSSVPAIRRMAPVWEDLGIEPHRASFAAEIARIRAGGDDAAE